MLIEFVPNPSFQPPAPAIRVGSVVKTMDGYKRFIEHIDKPRGRYDLWGHGWHTRDFFEPLPERVSGWDEKGPQFSPIDPPPQEFSWADYPPRAGMVVEYVNRVKYVIFGMRGVGWTPVTCDGTRNDSVSDEGLTRYYRLRPDLMPRFVEGKP